MFLSDSVDFSCLIAKSVGQYNAQNDIFLANTTHTHNRILLVLPIYSKDVTKFEIIF
jgi:hypothetical protein